MTHEQVIGSNASKLETISDEQLLAFYSPYLKVTRPELALPDGPKRTVNSKDWMKTNDYKVKAAIAMAIAEKAGIKLKL